MKYLECWLIDVHLGAKGAEGYKGTVVVPGIPEDTFILGDTPRPDWTPSDPFNTHGSSCKQTFNTTRFQILNQDYEQVGWGPCYKEGSPAGVLVSPRYGAFPQCAADLKRWQMEIYRRSFELTSCWRVEVYRGLNGSHGYAYTVSLPGGPQDKFEIGLPDVDLPHGDPYDLGVHSCKTMYAKLRYQIKNQNGAHVGWGLCDSEEKGGALMNARYGPFAACMNIRPWARPTDQANATRRAPSELMVLPSSEASATASLDE